MKRTISIRFNNSGTKIDKVTGKPGSKQESESLNFGEAFLKAFPTEKPEAGSARPKTDKPRRRAGAGAGLPSRPTHSKPAGSPRYDQQMDARTWLRANGYQDIAERIDRLIAQWKADNKKTRRDWWLILAGSPRGNPSHAGGKPWPMIAAFRKRQGYPVHSDAIERSPHELAPNVFAQKRWGSGFKRAVK